LDRYVDLYLKYHDPARIRAVCLIVWGNPGIPSGNPYQKEKYDERGLPKQTRGTFTVTAVAADGKRTDMPIPKMGTKEFEDFWRGAIGAARASLAKRGLAGKICIGMPADPSPHAPVVAAFRNILPEAGWFVGNHPGCRGYRYVQGDRTKLVPAVHVERVYTSPIPDPSKKRQFGWKRKDMALGFNRYGFGPLCLYPTPCVWSFRIVMETDLAANHRGAGRIGADYWRMGLKSKSGGAGTFYARYPQSATGQTGMAANTADLLAAGPDGPVTTARFENLREGIQNAEAVIVIQKALLDEKITGAKAKALWSLLDERVNAMRVVSLGLGRAGWQDRDRRLHQAAADVARLLASAPKTD